MITITRKEFKKDPVWNKLYQVIKRMHKPAEHTKRVLIQNKDTKDFCEEAMHFAVLPANGQDIFIHYETWSWFKAPDGVRVSIRNIGMYEDQAEYEIARLRGLHSTKDSDIPNIN